MSAVPLTATIVAVDVSVITEPVGAVSGTLSQPLTTDASRTAIGAAKIARMGRRRSGDATIG